MLIFAQLNLNKFLVFCIPEYVKNPLLENAINKDNFTFGKMRELVTITNLLWDEKKQTMNKKLLSISGKTKITGSTLHSEPDQPTNMKLKLSK